MLMLNSYTGITPMLPSFIQIQPMLMLNISRQINMIGTMFIQIQPMLMLNTYFIPPLSYIYHDSNTTYVNVKLVIPGHMIQQFSKFKYNLC